MQIYLDSFAAFLSVKNGQFRVRLSNGETRLFAVRTVNAILLTKGTGMSTDAALLAVEQDIPVLLMDAQTHAPLALISSGKPGNIATVRKNQPEFCRSSDAFQWVAQVLAQKIRAQQALIEIWIEKPDTPADHRADGQYACFLLHPLADRIQHWPIHSGENTLLPLKTRRSIAESWRGIEGTASRIYFQQISTQLSGIIEFEGRQQRPAYDPFNALLNYLYGMLYTSCHLALLKNGLDPYLGILHADQYGDRPTLVYDFIEPFRPWADQVALDLYKSGTILEVEAFEPDPENRGLWLSKPGKDIVIDAMLDFMETSTTYERKNVKRRVQLDLAAQQLAVLVKKGMSEDEAIE